MMVLELSGERNLESCNAQNHGADNIRRTFEYLQQHLVLSSESKKKESMPHVPIMYPFDWIKVRPTRLCPVNLMCV